jgi:predicted PurR-regulated permease PerM
VSPIKSLDTTSGASRLVVLGALIVAIACLYWARIVFIPVALATLATFLLSPAVALLRRIGLHRVASVVVVMVLTVLIVVGVGWALFSQITTLADDLPQYRATISRKIADVQRVGKGSTLQKVEETAQDVMAQLEHAEPATKKPMPVVVSAPSPIWKIPKIVEPIGGAIFVLVLVVFMLVQQRELRARVVRLFGSDRLAETTRALDDASERISRYLLTQTALNASFGVTIAIGLFVLGLPFALTWGVFAALLRFIPYAGAWAAAAVPVLVSLAVFDGWMKPLLIVGLFAGTEAIIVFVLEPLFFAKSAGVSSIALLISVAFWSWLWGPIGLALAIPLTVCLVVFSHTVKGLEFIGGLVDDDPGLDHHIIFYQRVLAGDDQEAAELVTEAVKAESDLPRTTPSGARPPAPVTTRSGPAPAGRIRPRDRDDVRGSRSRHPGGTDARAGHAELQRGRARDRRGLSGQRRSDQVVLTILNRLLDKDGYTVQIAPAGALVSEMIAAVMAMKPASIFVSSLEESGRARHLVKRLRTVCPDIPIVVGAWGQQGSSTLRTDLCAAGADDVVTTLAQARSDLLRLTPAPERAPTADNSPMLPGPRQPEAVVAFAASPREAS